MALLNGRIRATRVLAVFLAGAAAWANVRGQAVDEYQLKAAFIYNFAKFVEWPPQAFRNASDPINVCILGQSPVGAALEQTVAGKTVDKRAFVVRQIYDTRGAAGCQILFVGSSEKKRWRAILGELNTAGILSVGDDEGFASSGGVANFKLEDGRIRIEVNVGAAEKERLRISAKLLNLAQIVKN
jgi:YfiR/HmsC-like